MAQHIKKKATVLVVEGFTDYLALYEKGLLNVVCTMGRMLSKEQIMELHKLASEIILGLDGDESGRKATLRIARKMNELGVKPYSIDYESHKNARSFINNESDAVKKIKDKMSSSEILK
jgi:DNA primase